MDCPFLAMDACTTCEATAITFQRQPQSRWSLLVVIVIMLCAVQIDPSLGKVQNEPNKRDIVATESSRLMPDLSIAIEANDSDRVPRP